MINYTVGSFSAFSALEKNCDSEEIVIFNAGFHHAQNEMHSYRRFERNYMILYQHLGNSYVRLNDKKVRLSPGSLYIFPPAVIHDIYYFNDNANERYYIFFNGTRVENVFKGLQLDTGFYEVGSFQEFVGTTKILIEELQKQNYGNRFFKNIIFLNLLALIHQKTQQGQSSNAFSILEPALSHMKSNIKEKILPTAEYAKMCFVSKSTFTKFFKQHTKLTPTQYFTNLKLSYIQSQLLESNKKINELADELHFEDPLYLSRVFKKYTGLSPSEFRKKFFR